MSNWNFGLCGVAQLVLALCAAEQNLGIAAEDVVLLIDPAYGVLEPFRNIFPPEVVEHRVGVGPDVARLLGVGPVWPAEGEGVCGAGDAAEIGGVRGDD